MVGVCEVPDLSASISQSSRYIIVLAPRLSTEMVFRWSRASAYRSSVRICTMGRSSHGSGI